MTTIINPRRINRTIIVERDSRTLTARVIDALDAPNGMAEMLADAEAARDDAQAAQAIAETARDESSDARDTAVQAALDADASEANAASSEGIATAAASTAVSARDAAVVARNAAQAWAESPTPPGGAGTESAKTAANRAVVAAQDAEDAAASIGSVVRYDAQTLTAPQQAQARDNIGAANSATAVVNSRTVTAGTGLTGGGDLTADRTIAADFASEAEALAGEVTDKVMSPARTMAAVRSKALGEGQTWKDVKSQRTYGTVYQNTSGRTIFVSITSPSTTGGRDFEVSKTNGADWSKVGALGGGDYKDSHVPIPSGWYYRITGGAITPITWMELRHD